MTCFICGTPFVSQQPHAKYCSNVCREVGRQRIQSVYAKVYYQKNKERIKKRVQSRAIKYPEKVKAAKRRSMALYHARYRKTKWMRLYGVSSEEYDRCVQQTTCSICQREARLVFDHDHNSGEHRGMLCGTCNSLLGHAHDNPDILRAAITYLERRPLQCEDIV